MANVWSGGWGLSIDVPKDKAFAGYAQHYKNLGELPGPIYHMRITG